MLNRVKSAFGGKKILAGLVLLSLVLGVAVPVLAAEAMVTATVTPGVVSVTVAPDTFGYGTMPLNTSKTSYEAGVTSGITATVGTVNTDLGIKGANATAPGPGTWTLDETAPIEPGPNIYVHQFGLNADPVSYTPLTTTSQVLASDVVPSGSQVFGLKITTPTSSTVTAEYNVPVTVIATWGG